MKDENKLPSIKSKKGIIALGVLTVLLLILALFVVPVVSARTGYSENIISLTGSAICFVIAFGSIGLRRMKDKKSA